MCRQQQQQQQWRRRLQTTRRRCFFSAHRCCCCFWGRAGWQSKAARQQGSKARQHGDMGIYARCPLPTATIARPKHTHTHTHTLSRFTRALCHSLSLPLSAWLRSIIARQPRVAVAFCCLRLGESMLFYHTCCCCCHLIVLRASVRLSRQHSFFCFYCFCFFFVFFFAPVGRLISHAQMMLPSSSGGSNNNASINLP